jgi:DNA repair exonuclease SbcCD ATPase subunit
LLPTNREMSRCSRSAKVAVVDFDAVADELYAVAPEEFVAARRTREEEARADGDRVLATSISRLPKPSLAAWATNLLVREHREEIESLVELGGLLREAQENLAGAELKALSVQRNQLLAALSRQVVGLARAHGHPVSSGIAGQVEETLRAAMADPDAGEAVLSARLTSSLSYSGLGTGQRPELRVVRTPPERPAPTKSKPKPTARTTAEERRRSAEERRRQEEEAARREAEERRRREIAEARAAAADAVRTAEEAAEAAEREQERADELESRHRELERRVEQLTEELARAREECHAAATQLPRAQRRRQAATRRAADAVSARDQAEARLAELEQG